MFPAAIETPRLRLIPRTHETVDTLDLYEICAHDDGIDEVTEYMPWNPHRTPKETHDFLDRGGEIWDGGDVAEYVIYSREREGDAHEIAGMGGLTPEWEKRRASLGLWLRRRFWGRGYSAERARALVALAFDHLDLEVVWVSHHVDNEKSQRAIRKYISALGGEREGRIRNGIPMPDGEVADEVRYSITREQWLEATDGEYEATFEWE